ncbi:MAG: hypothetical protein H6845_01175 [Alphaproteobacteria bacterium]|nr:MAG: hypothetical protein H6845_01175 [Alphaproteobacteria bacterium]
MKEKALIYHSNFPQGKWGTRITKPSGPSDLSLAYSPGVAYPCLEIQNNPEDAKLYTAKQNIVAVISNGTAVLGLGNIGALASKPVMEGKCMLMNKMAGIDGIDIEINESDPDKIIEIIKKISPTFGAINLEDIKSPECFYIEKELQNLGIPVFHDDQHGTAIVTAAGLENALKLTNRSWSEITLVMNGAGAAGIACLDMMVSMGLQTKNIMVFDSKGLLTIERSDLTGQKRKYASVESCSLEDALNGADVFVGVSCANALEPAWLKSMNPNPIIFALANPDPEILPNLAREARQDCIVATGRSDFPNQINNVLCFPYIFRGALDSGAKFINDDMKKACVESIASLARNDDKFGPEYIIPNALDERLGLVVSQNVAKAAIKSGAGHSVADQYGRCIESRLNEYSANYFSMYKKCSIDLTEAPRDLTLFLDAWDTPVDNCRQSTYAIAPFQKSCTEEKLLWIFNIDHKPWIAYSTNNNRLVKPMLERLSFLDIPPVPVTSLEQCKILEKIDSFCGILSLNGNALNMKFNAKLGTRSIAYLTLILSGVIDEFSSNKVT